MKYTLTWSATCPRCDEKMSNKDTRCSNCGKGEIRVNQYRSGQEWHVHFGCWACAAALGRLKCRQCGASIQSEQVSTGTWPAAIGVTIVCVAILYFFIHH